MAVVSWPLPLSDEKLAYNVGSAGGQPQTETTTWQWWGVMELYYTLSVYVRVSSLPCLAISCGV